MSSDNSNQLPKTNAELQKKYFDKKKHEFELNCNQGDAGACFALGEWYILFGKDLEKGAELFKENCVKKKHGNSCFSLSQIYRTGSIGEETEQDRYKMVYDYTDKACQYGTSEACGVVGYFKLHGFGCKKDALTGMKELAKSCESNNPIACFQAGRVYLDGEKKHGIKRNPEESFKLMKRGCDLGHPNCCQVLSVMYLKGDGVTKSDELHEKYKRVTQDIIKQTGERMGATVVA